VMSLCLAVWLPLRAPVCQQCRMLLPLAPRAQGAMKSSFGDDKRLARGGRGALVVERWLIRLLDRVHVGEARRTIELLACGPQSINARAHTFKTSHEPPH
jgi:hypothetical protein